MGNTTVALGGCKECGQQLVRKGGGPPPTYCSGQCRARACTRRAKADGRAQQWAETSKARRDAEKTVNVRPCPYCKDPMTHPRRVQCGKPECERLWTNERHLAWQHAYLAANGEWSQRRYAERQSKKDKAARVQRRALGLPSQRQLNPATYAKSDAKRRMVFVAAKLETFKPVEIFNRDRWICGICLSKVDPKAKAPDPLSASVDHIVPLSEGGDHARANCRLAHYGCNSSRRNRGGGEQLSLIG